MSTTIEQLELEIQSNSTSAVAGIEALAASLSKLRDATKGGLGLKAIANSMKAINEADISGSTQKIQEFANALSPLSKLSKSNLSSFISPLEKLPKVLSELNKIDMSAFSSKMQEVAKAMKPLADEMEKVSNGFSAFPDKIQKLLNSTDKIPSSNKKASASFTDLYHSMLSVGKAAINTGKTIYEKFIKPSSEYNEVVNLFNTSLGQYAKTAYDTADTLNDIKGISEVMGIDPKEWMKSQGVFMTLSTGFGVAGDKADKMSKQLTQLGYDISSFQDISVEDAMLKLQSGLSGELEPLRRIGYDLSQAKLEAVALELGITKSLSSMTQAEKAQLRYYAIMTQVTQQHGDMAKTINEPANQMRIFAAQIQVTARSIGNMFIPMLQAVLPTATAVVQVIGALASTIAGLFGYKEPIIGEETGIDNLASGAETASESLEDAADEAKKLKSYMLGFDELNVINPNEGSSSDVGGALDEFDFALPEYEFLPEGMESKISTIVEEMKEWLGLSEDIDSWSEFFDTRLGNILEIVGMIGVGLLAWKITPGLISAIDKISSLKSLNIEWGFKIVGATLLLSDLDKLKQYIEDFLENGATFSNVTGMLSEFAGALGDVMIILGNVKTGGALKVIQGLGEIASAIADIATNGVDFTNVTDLIRGLSNVAIGVGFLTGNMTLAGAGMIIQGFTTVIQELAENWEAIKQGDWSGVDKTTLIIGAITAIGGIVTALDVFHKLKKATKVTEAVESIKEVETVTETVSKSTSAMTGKLKTLAQDLAWGLVIVAEVAAAAILIVGAIWVLGLELEQVGIAWQPVIDNGATVAIAIGLGTTILVGVGAATALLGKLGGTSLITNIALGTAILAEVGAASILFIAEIWAIGEMLGKVGEAWQPVIDNGETIATAIGLGALLLSAIGVATALLGTLGTTMIVNIALGTAILAELGIATALFIVEVWVIGELLNKVSESWQPVIDNGDTVATAIGLGTVLLVAIGAATALLGTLGVPMIVNIALGTAMLLELGIATGLFIAEVWAIGEMLNKVNDAWTPINGKGETIAKAIGVGTGLLIGIGAVAAVLGAASVATVGALPLAIGAGTALLVELGIAFVEFTESIIVVSDQLRDELYPSMSATNEILPGLADDMKAFTSFMGQFAKEVGNYSKSTAIAGFKATIDKIIDFFTSDPIKRMSESVAKQYKQAVTLVDELDKAIPIIEEATEKMQDYNDAMNEFEKTSGFGSDKNGIKGYNLDFVVNIKNTASTWWSNVKTWWSGKVGSVSDFKTNVKDDSSSWWSNTKTWWSQDSKNGVDLTVNAKKGWTSSLKSALGIGDIDLGFKLPKIGISWGEKEVLGFKISYPSGFYTYAQGGFPEQGEMFIAREAGAEMVGTIGRKTAVANNDQIVSGIAGGVAEANAEQNVLLREQNSLLRAILEKDSGVYLDGKNLTNSVEKYQRERGRVLITGGVL